MSWLFSRALVEEYLVDTFLDGEPSAPLSGSHTPLAYLPPDRMTDFSRLSRFGVTFKPLTVDRGEELLMSFRAGSLVKTFQSQDEVPVLMENAQECGDTWRGWLAKFDPDSCSWKTAQCSLLEDLNESSLTLPRSGMTRGGLLWELPTLERHTSETGFGLWPTPTASMMPCEGTVRIMRKKWLAGEVTLEEASVVAGRDVRAAQGKVPAMWPTPRSFSAMAAKITPESVWAENRRSNLETIVGRRMWPTPAARDYKGANGFNTTNQKLKQGKRAQMDQLPNALQQELGQPIGGTLNPMWVEWLMGWPLGWTDLKPLEMDKSLCVQPQPGAS